MHKRHDWATLVAEQARSGLTQKAFCAQHGIYPANLRRARLRIEARTARTPAAVPAARPFVQVAPPARPVSPLELAFGTLTLRFASTTSPAVVAALVKALT